MKVTVDYGASPAKLTDALADVIEYFGDRWPDVRPLMAQIVDPAEFEAFANFAGVEGLPVRAWYEHYHGGEAWDAAWAAAKLAKDEQAGVVGVVPSLPNEPNDEEQGS